MKNNIALFLLFCYTCCYSQETDLFSYSNSLKFANYLYRNREYNMAIPEFKRILFMDSLNIQANIKIRDCYIRSGKYSDGLKYSAMIYPKSIKNDTLAILHCKLLLLNNDFDFFHSFILHSHLTSKENTYLEMSESFFQKDWKHVVIYLDSVKRYPDLNQFVPIIEKAGNIRYKKPLLSLAFSAIVPGTGKLYSGYWKDGLFSFLFVGVSAWQSYRGFSQKGIKSAYGWLMCGISLSFYSGNLYGSVKAANKKNYETEHAVINDFEKTFIDSYSDF